MNKRPVFAVFIIFIGITVGCENKRYVFSPVIGIGVSDPNDLPVLMFQAQHLENSLESLGFKQVSLTDNSQERHIKLEGNYKRMKDLKISISCLKYLETKRSELRIEVTSKSYLTKTCFPDGEELSDKINEFLQEAVSKN